MKTYTSVEDWSDDDKDLDRVLGCSTADGCSMSRVEELSVIDLVVKEVIKVGETAWHEDEYVG